MSEPISVVLDKAADLIEQRGWQRGGGWWMGGPSIGRLCAEGALQLVLGIPHSERKDKRLAFMNQPAYQYMLAFVGAEALHRWNDEYMPYGHNVVRTFRMAAIQAREDERMLTVLKVETKPFKLFRFRTKSKDITSKVEIPETIVCEEKELISA